MALRPPESKGKKNQHQFVIVLFKTDMNVQNENRPSSIYQFDLKSRTWGRNFRKCFHLGEFFLTSSLSDES